MSTKKPPRLFTKKWLESLTSGVRWGFLGLGIAVVLFCFEIWLSLMQLSDVFGVGIAMEDMMRILIIVGLWFFLLVPIAVVVYGIFALVVWRAKPVTDNSLHRLKNIEKRLARTESKLNTLAKRGEKDDL